jgi:hypothetical protein
MSDHKTSVNMLSKMKKKVKLICGPHDDQLAQVSLQEHVHRGWNATTGDYDKVIWPVLNSNFGRKEETTTKDKAVFELVSGREKRLVQFSPEHL